MSDFPHNQQALEKRADKILNDLMNALGEDIDNDEYAETKEAMGEVYTIQHWLSFQPGILQLAKISEILGRIEDCYRQLAVANNFAPEEPDA